MLRGREYIYAVYQEGSFSKAAAKLFVSQPALSTTIKKTEDTLGTAIFNRNTSPITLTEAGRYYISCIEQVMEIEAKMESYFNNEESQRIIIGSSAFFCAHILPELREKFLKKYPQYKVELVEADAPTLKKSLKEGSIDFMLEVEQLDGKSYHSLVLYQEHLLLLVPKSYAINQNLAEYRLNLDDIKNNIQLVGNIPSVSIYHFRNEKFLFLKQGNDCHDRGLQICNNAEFHPSIAMYLDQMLTAYYVAASGKGVTFVRSYIADYAEPTDKLYFYKINDAKTIRNVYLHTKKKLTTTRGELDFKDFLRNEFL